MARATWLADVLTTAGLTIKPFPGWETRGNSFFTPVGVILHHTVTKPTTADATVDRILALTGSSSTPAPLCNYSTNRDGTVSVIAAGTANHGGVGVWNNLSGNRYWFGDEMKNLGTPTAEPWAPIQLTSARIAAAAVLRHIGSDESWVCGHKEYAPTRKVDPHTLNMNTERELIAALLNPSQPEDNLLPIEPTAPPETIRLLQNRLNIGYTTGLTLDGNYGPSTIEAVRVNLGDLSGDPVAKEGKRVVARQWDGLLQAVIRKTVTPSGGLSEAQVKAIVNSAVVHVD